MRDGRAGISKAGAPARSRIALLQAGAELLLEDAQRNPFAGLRVRGVCERAGYSTGAFYVHWPDSGAYHDALSRYLLAEDAGHFESEFAHLAGLAEGCEIDDPAGAVLALADADLGALLANPLWDAIQLFGLTWGRDRFREDAAEGFRDVDRDTAGIYGALLGRLGREVRPPLDAGQLGAVLQALIEGCASRHRVDPAAIDCAPHPGAPGHYLYAIGVAALLAVLTRPVGDPRDLPATLAQLLPRPPDRPGGPAADRSGQPDALLERPGRPAQDPVPSHDASRPATRPASDPSPPAATAAAARAPGTGTARSSGQGAGNSRAGISNAEALERSRRALLHAGAELLVEDAQRNPFAGLRVRGVCEQARYTTGAFYLHWPDSGAYHDALSRYLLAEESGHWAADAAALARQSQSCEIDEPVPAALGLAAAEIEAVLGNPWWDALQFVEATWGRTRYRDVAAQGFTEVDRDTAGIYGALLGRLGREVRPPLDSEQLGALLQALIEGCASRHRVDPAAIDCPPHPGAPEHYIYAVGVAALLAVLTRPAGDPRDLPATLGQALAQPPPDGPNDPADDPSYNLGALLERQGRPDEAEAAYHRGHPAAANRLGLLLEQRGDLAGAEHHAAPQDRNRPAPRPNSRPRTPGTLPPTISSNSPPQGPPRPPHRGQSSPGPRGSTFDRLDNRAVPPSRRPAPPPPGP